MNSAVQFLLIDHLLATGIVVGTIGVMLKVWVFYHCPSHPLYRGKSRSMNW